MFFLQVTNSGLLQSSPQVIADQAKLLAEENKLGVFFDGWEILFNATGDPGLTINDGINDPPEFFNLPDITFPEDSLATLDLNNYVFDLDHSDNELNFSASIIDFTPISNDNIPGESHTDKRERRDARILDIQDLQIAIDNISHVTSFSMTHDSSGLFRVSFTVSDPEGLSDTDTMNVTVLPINDAPLISELPFISFNEDETLDYPIAQWYTYVEDVDNLDNSLNYTVESGNHILVNKRCKHHLKRKRPAFLSRFNIRIRFK